MGADGTYGGLLGAYPYALRQSDSWLFRIYVVASAIAGVYVALLLVLGAIAWVANPGLLGEKSLLGVIGLLVLAPLSFPVLVVARRYRLGVERPDADWLLGLAGFVFVGALYVGVFVTDPADHATAGPLGGIVAVLDSLPPTYGLAFPVVATVLIYLVVRWTR